MTQSANSNFSVCTLPSQHDSRVCVRVSARVDLPKWFWWFSYTLCFRCFFVNLSIDSLISGVLFVLIGKQSNGTITVAGLTFLYPWMYVCNPPVPHPCCHCNYRPSVLWNKPNPKLSLNDWCKCYLKVFHSVLWMTQKDWGSFGQLLRNRFVRIIHWISEVTCTPKECAIFNWRCGIQTSRSASVAYF